MSDNVLGKTTPFSKMARPGKPKSERLTDPLTLALNNDFVQPIQGNDMIQRRLYPDRTFDTDGAMPSRRRR